MSAYERIAELIGQCTDILSVSNEQARLEENIRRLEQAVKCTEDGSHQRHCMNLRLTDAYAALFAFQRDKRDMEGTWAN